MNSWKEAPHLFCGGKFQVNDGKEVYRIIGVTNSWGVGVSFICNHSIEIHATPRHCKLVARPISDMSDEEKTKAMVSVNLGGKYDTIKELYENPIDFFVFHLAGRTEVLLYLLSIGVYPFDQNHNDIIWRYENTNR